MKAMSSTTPRLLFVKSKRLMPKSTPFYDPEVVSRIDGLNSELAHHTARCRRISNEAQPFWN
jgi:hypothetical protein